MSIASNLERTKNEIADACARAHRDPTTVALMAVSKMHPAESIREAYAAGQRLFGENRVQEWQTKRTELADLFADTTQSLSSAAQALNKTLRILIEVKLSPEDTKHGLAPEDLPTLLRALAPLTHLEPRGLMTVPPFDENPETARPYFQHLRRLRDDNLALCPTLTELSMGMSNDFAVAIEEGSTTVRIGTAIFGKRIYA